MRRYAAEAIGTFALVFAGTGAIVVNHVTGGEVTHVGVALTFGMVVATMIYAVGDVSGAHLNPAVSVGFWLARRLPARDIAPYVASQCAGALAASLLLLVDGLDSAQLGARFVVSSQTAKRARQSIPRLAQARIDGKRLSQILDRGFVAPLGIVERT